MDPADGAILGQSSQKTDVILFGNLDCGLLSHQLYYFLWMVIMSTKLCKSDFLFRFDGRYAHKNLANNSFGVWSKRTWYEEEEKAALSDVPKRLQQDVFVPEFKGKFHLNPQDGVFAMGSCFARVIEDAFESAGSSVMSRPVGIHDHPHFSMRNPHVRSVEFVNRYNTASMLLEIRRLLDPEFMFSDCDLIYKYPNGATHDLHYYDLWTCSAEQNEALLRRHFIADGFSSIKNSRVIVLTLGLVEAWFDKEANLHLNMTPSSELVDAHSDRFEFHLLGYKENLSNLLQIHDLLKRFGNPEFKMIVTVSPVPLGATFTTDDVFIANTRSKSILRAVAEDFSRMFDNVDYFPSFEVVQGTGVLKAYLCDGRHVRQEVGAQIVNLFQCAYYS